MSEWTQGPWALERAKSPVDGGYDHGIIAVIQGKSTVIAEAYERVGENIKAPSWANAALISSAPDLYKALQAALKCIVDDLAECGYDEDDIMDHEVVKQARVALAKARGQT